MQTITEEMGVHKDWYKVRPGNVEQLAAFVQGLISDYHHDYGTICHAAAAAALAAARTVDADPEQGGITGFQAGAIMWQFIRQWQHIDGPMWLVQYSNMLYPQNVDRFQKTIPLETFRWLQEEAKRLIETDGAVPGLDDSGGCVAPKVMEHWKRIADGEVPFGFQISE